MFFRISEVGFELGEGFFGSAFVFVIFGFKFCFSWLGFIELRVVFVLRFGSFMESWYFVVFSRVI